MASGWFWMGSLYKNIQLMLEFLIPYSVECRCHVWAGAPSCCLELLDKLQNIYRAVGPSLAALLEPLVHYWNVASLSLFYRYYFGRFSSELAQLAPLRYFWGRSTCYSDRLHNFSIIIPRFYKDVYVNSFFPHTARLWNSLPRECFPLTYDLNGFKPIINRHLLTEVLSKQISCMLYSVCASFSCNSTSHSSCLVLQGVNPS